MSAFAEPDAIQRQAIAGALEATEQARRANLGAWIVDYMAIHDLQVQLGDASGAEATRVVMRQAIGSSPDERDANWVAFALFLSREGRDAEAADALRQVSDRGVRERAIADLAATYGSRGDAAQAVAAIARLPRGETREQAITLSAQRAANERHYDVVRQILSQSADTDHDQAAAFMIANAAIAAGDFVQAQAAASQVTNAQARINVLQPLGAALTDAGRAGEALAPLREAAALVRAMDEGFLREISAKLMAEELAAAGDFEGALALSPLAGEEAGEAHAAIALQQARARQFEAAQRTIALIPADQSHLRDQARADVIAERIALGLDPPSAASRISDASLRGQALTRVALWACQAGNSERVREMLVLARSASMQQNSEDRDAGLLEVARAQAECGLGEDARETATAIRSSAERADALAGAAQAFARSGAGDQAVATYRQALSAGRGRMGAEDYGFIVEMMAESGLVDEALAAARTMPRRDFDEEWARGNAFLSVIAALTAAGRREEALALVADTGDRRGLAYRSIAGERPRY